MSSSFDNFQKRRLITSYFSVVLSVFLVLFLLGILGFFIINSKKLSDDFREGIAMSVYSSLLLRCGLKRGETPIPTQLSTCSPANSSELTPLPNCAAGSRPTTNGCGPRGA